MKIKSRKSKETRAIPVGEGRLRALVAAVSTAGLAIYLTLSAKALNLDGLGYAGRVESGDFNQLLLPGHLLYGPIMYLLHVILPGADTARMMQACDSIFAAAGVGVFIAALKRLSVSTFTAVSAGLALAFTYTYWTHATDLTTYALSTFCLISAFYLLCAARVTGKVGRVWGISGMVAFATLIHQSNLVFLPAAMVGVGRRNALKLAAISLVLMCLPYAILGWVVTGSHSPTVIAKWAAQAAHGYPMSFEPVNMARGVYGFANAVVYLDDAGTMIKGRAAQIDGAGLSSANMLRLAGKAAFLVALLGMPVATLARRRKLTDQQKWVAKVCWVWIVPYALVALLFFTTDHDRWIMLLPAVIALVAIAYPRPSPRGKLAAVGAVAILFTLNLSSAIYPAHLGTSNKYYQEAIRLTPKLTPTDLVIFWGHDHIGTPGYLRQLKHVEAMHIVDLVLKNGKQAGLREVTTKVEDATHRNRRVLVIGFYGVRDQAGDCLSEAHALGLSRTDVSQALAHFTARPIFSSDSDTIYMLSDNPRPQGPAL